MLKIKNTSPSFHFYMSVDILLKKRLGQTRRILQRQHLKIFKGGNISPFGDNSVFDSQVQPMAEPKMS